MAVPDQVLTALTTEHFGLSGARSQAAGESATRASLYLSSVSSTLVALGLVASVDDARRAFTVFALVALPTVFVLGVFTFVRLVELGAEDLLLGRAINRIRALYLLEAGDEHRRYFLLNGHDDAIGVIRNMGIAPTCGQLLFTAAVMVATVNAVVGGSAVGLAVGRALQPPLGVAVAAGAASAVVALVVALRHQTVRRSDVADSDVLFPSEG